MKKYIFIIGGILILLLVAAFFAWSRLFRHAGSNLTDYDAAVLSKYDMTYSLPDYEVADNAGNENIRKNS